MLDARRRWPGGLEELHVGFGGEAEPGPAVDGGVAAVPAAGLAVDGGGLLAQLVIAPAHDLKLAHAFVAAGNAILDRGYGKPAVEIGGDAAMLPFMAAPALAVSISSEIRAEARRYATLAIEVLRKISDSGASESARVSAAKSLLDRGLGTVASARMPEE